MASYFTAAFLILFLPMTLVVYGLVPARGRWAVLLVASYAFFAIVSGALLAFLLISTLSVYLAGLAMGRLLDSRDALLSMAKTGDGAKAGKKEIKLRCKKRMRWVLAAVVVLNIGILVALKYLGFFGQVAGSALGLLGIDFALVTPSIGVPLGISFYTLMAISYCVDVYREQVVPDAHLGRLALFLAFFPQIMEGPICRYGQTAQDLHKGSPLNSKNLYEGSLRMLVGLAKKLIIADRLNLFIKAVFDNYGNYDGSIITVGAVLYTVQLYFDFSGTMDVALGIAQMFNVKLPENFRQPFFSRRAGEFWQRWHITLGTWLRDYVYYPVSLSKPCKSLTKRARKLMGNRYGPLVASSVALFCVWVGNGLWHGAGSQYLFFGMYYFVLIVAGGLVEPLVADFAQKHRINRDAVPYRGFQIARTLVIIVVGELFFRAKGLDAGIAMFNKMLFEWTGAGLSAKGIGAMGMSAEDWIILSVFVLIFLVIDVLQERGRRPLAWAGSQPVFVKWAVWTLVLCSFVVFGAYGYGYVPVDPMYAQF